MSSLAHGMSSMRTPVVELSLGLCEPQEKQRQSAWVLSSNPGPVSDWLCDPEEVISFMASNVAHIFQDVGVLKEWRAASRLPHG